MIVIISNKGIEITSFPLYDPILYGYMRGRGGGGGEGISESCALHLLEEAIIEIEQLINNSFKEERQCALEKKRLFSGKTLLNRLINRLREMWRQCFKSQ